MYNRVPSKPPIESPGPLVSPDAGHSLPDFLCALVHHGGSWGIGLKLAEHGQEGVGHHVGEQRGQEEGLEGGVLEPG